MPSLRKSKHSPCRDKVGAGLRQTGPLAQLNRAFDYGSKGYRFESCGDHKDARLLNTINKSRICFAELAQLVERWLPKPKVTSSSLAFRSKRRGRIPKGIRPLLLFGRLSLAAELRFVHRKSISVDSQSCLHVLSTKRAFQWTISLVCAFCPRKRLFRG